MSDIVPYDSGQRLTLAQRRELSRSDRRQLAQRLRTSERVQRVQDESLVATEKALNVAMVARSAMSNQALLGVWRDTLATDPVIAEDLAFFAKIAKHGQGEIIARLIDTYTREGR